MGKYLRKKKAKVNIPLRIAAVLYCLTVLTTYLVSGLYARYTVSGQASDQARVAKFSIKGGDVFSQSIEAEFVPGAFKEVPIVIYNNSEVAVEYTVDIENVTKNLPLTLTLVEKDDSLELTSDETGTRFTGERLPGDHYDKYTLTIAWREPTNDTKAEDLNLMGMVDYITVTVTATQID